METNNDLKKEEIYEFKPFRVPKYQITLQNVNALINVADYVWYTPAMLYLWGKYSDVQLSDIVRLNNIKVFWHKFEKPIFKGFTLNGDPSWNHALWAAESKDWEKIVQGILETVQFDLKAKKIYRYALQELNIYDPLFCDKQNVLNEKTPVIKINVFAVLANDKQYAFDLNSDNSKNVLTVPQVITFKPDNLHATAAKKLFENTNLTSEKAFALYKQILIDQHKERFLLNKGK